MRRSRAVLGPVTAGTPSPLAFRLPGAGSEPPWLSDEMGGAFEPGDPRMNRRDFLWRVALAATAVTVGGAINVLVLAAADASTQARR